MFWVEYMDKVALHMTKLTSRPCLKLCASLQEQGRGTNRKLSFQKSGSDPCLQVTLPPEHSAIDRDYDSSGGEHERVPQRS